MSRIITLLLGAAAGAAAAHFLDPESGRRRRAQLTDKATSKARSGAATVQTTAQQAANKVQGAAATATPTGGSEADDDVSLARKVETTVFRDANAPKGDISVDVQAGVVYLRGTADDDWSARIAAEAAKVDGIEDVKNLLHRPGTPAPSAEPRGAISER
jgi:osmotically-inducible protein OsmY